MFVFSFILDPFQFIFVVVLFKQYAFGKTAWLVSSWRHKGPAPIVIPRLTCRVHGALL